MKCPYCYKVNPDDANNCAYCGKSLHKDDGRKKVSVVPIIVIALAVIATVLVIHFSGRNRNSYSYNGGSNGSIDIGTPDPRSTPFGVDPSIDPNDLPSPTESPSGSPGIDTEVTPTPAPEDTKFIFFITEIYEDKTVTANGHEVYFHHERDTASYICVDSENIKTDHIERAFLVTFESGNLCILTTEWGFENVYVASYGFDGQHLFNVTQYEFCRLSTIDGDTVIMTVPVDCFGTWPIEDPYSVGEDFYLESQTDYLVVTDREYKAIKMTTLCDIYAYDENGNRYVVEAGTVLHMKAIDFDTPKFICAIFVTEDGREARVDYIPSDEGGFCVLTPDGRKDEYDVFDNLPYSD